MNYLLPIIFGIGFGYIMSRVGAFEYANILNALRLKDLQIPKFMLFTVAVSAVGFFSLHALGLVSLNLIATNLGADLLGGLIFGVGFALAGYCPGTSIGAWGEGKRDAQYAVFGGVFGVLVYTILREFGLVLRTSDLGEISLIDFIPLSPLAVAVLFSVILVGFLYAVDYWEERKNKGGDLL